MKPVSEDHSRWTADGLPLAVEYSKAVMQDIRAAVMDGFYKIPHGGIEVGGVLYGRSDGNLVRIEAFRPLACEYAAGPSFSLSERDRAALARLLDPAGDVDLRGMVPVGWYHSHTRSELRPSEEDLDIHREFFPKRWQVCLILRPERTKPVRAGFFVRDSDGSLKTESGDREFTLEAAGRAKGGLPRHASRVETAPMATGAEASHRRMWVAVAVAALFVLIGFFSGVVVTLIFWR